MKTITRNCSLRYSSFEWMLDVLLDQKIWNTWTKNEKLSILKWILSWVSYLIFHFKNLSERQSYVRMHNRYVWMLASNDNNNNNKKNGTKYFSLFLLLFISTSSAEAFLYFPFISLILLYIRSFICMRQGLGKMDSIKYGWKVNRIKSIASAVAHHMNPWLASGIPIILS